MRKIMVLIALLSATAADAAEDRVIARVGERNVMYGEVFCDSTLAAQNASWLKGLPLEDACRQYEQEEFQRVMARELVRSACALRQCEPSDADLEPFRSPVLKDEALLQRLVAEARRIPEAIARVYRGESLETVYAESIKARGHSLEQFRQEVARFRSLEVVERFLAKDFAASALRSYEEQARDRAMRALLRNQLEAAAAASGQSVGEAADELLRTLTTQVGVSIVDPRFQMPSGREIFL